MESFITFMCLALATVLCFWGSKTLRKNLQQEFNNSRVIPKPNGKGYSLSLYRVNGCGMSFSGEFRQVSINGIVSYVTYHFLHLFFIPLIPFGAYRVIDAKNGGYHVLGSEKMSVKEIGAMALQTLAWLLTIVSVLSLIFSVVKLFDK